MTMNVTDDGQEIVPVGPRSRTEIINARVRRALRRQKAAGEPAPVTHIARAAGVTDSKRVHELAREMGLEHVIAEKGGGSQ